MYVIVIITCPDNESAEKISGVILGQRLAACVNIAKDIKSFFWWGKRRKKIHSAEEMMLFVKTKQSLLRKLIREVKKVHPYSVPEIIALPIVGGSKEYTQWIEEETRN
ncbi:MAG: divalent-cation tolerance protein CutA [Candidatus Aenigmarchaeota archaeon]|nr:divalent-cation tolerance protein CutA [Candidatus Aenigmarchaeota archaeon]